VVEPKPNRRDRRAMQFGEPRTVPETIPDPTERKGFRLDFTLAFFLALIALIIAIHPPQSRISMGVALSLLFVVGVYPLLHFIMWLFTFLDKDCYDKYGLPVHSLALIALVIGTCTWGHAIWPPIRRHKLNEKEIALFKSVLGIPSSNVKQTVEIACPEHDESVCVYSSQFVQYFGDAGWDVKGKVERVTLARPQSGVVLVERGGDPKKAFDWNTGGWTAMTPDVESLYRAFKSIGITLGSSAGPFVEDGVIIVWFGEEREDESADTELTTALENMRKLKKQYPPDGIPPDVAKQYQP
jgi:hypothetical protein